MMLKLREEWYGRLFHTLSLNELSSLVVTLLKKFDYHLVLNCEAICNVVLRKCFKNL